EFSLDRPKEGGAGTRDPPSRLCSLCPGRYVPGCRKGTEVIQANQVDVGQQRPQARDAPTIAGLTQSVPIIDGVAPKLSLRTEVNWRYTSDNARPALRIQQKKLRVSPDVARVWRDEEGQVADQAQPLGASMRLEPLALAEQQKPGKAHPTYLIRQFTSD